MLSSFLWNRIKVSKACMSKKQQQKFRDREKEMKKMLYKAVGIVLGTLLMALAVNLIYEPMHMVTGGISGLAIAVKELTKNVIPGGVPVWLTNILVNLPIFLWGYHVKGKGFLCSTFLANICFTVFLLTIPVVEIANKDYFLATVTGGVLTGTGLGLVFVTGTSTGGTDLLSSILHEYFKVHPVSEILFVVDAVIILAGAVTFGVFSTVYAVIAVFLTSKIMDEILSGLKVGKQIWIISDRYQQISREIISCMDRGVTGIDGKGMYTDRSRKLLLCVVGKRQVIPVVDIVRRNDEKAFVVIQDVREIMGEGFGKK